MALESTPPSDIQDAPRRIEEEPVGTTDHTAAEKGATNPAVAAGRRSRARCLVRLTARTVIDVLGRVLVEVVVRSWLG